MHLHWWTLALQAVNVLILVWLLTRVLYRPVMNAIAARQAAADKLLADAQQEKTAAQQQAAALKAQQEGFAAEAAQRQAQMRAAVEAERARLLDQARTEAASVLQKSDEATAAARARMTNELEDRAASVAASMAERLVNRLPSAAVSDAMFQVLIEGLRALPEQDRCRLAAGPLRVITAAPLGEATRARYLQSLALALPGSAPPAFEVDAQLIGGFELHGQHLQVRNSWRADLDAMLAKLRENA